MKLKQNAKYLFTTPEGAHFIFFQNNKAALLIEIIEHNSLAAAKNYITDNKENYDENNVPFLSAMTNVDTLFYTLVAIRIFNLGLEITNENADEMSSVMRRLADWYRYTYLIPIAQGRSPIN